MVALISSLVAVFKGAPAIKSMIDSFVEMWLTYQDKKIDEEYDDKKAKRDMLIFTLKNAPDDETRKQASRELYRLGANH